MVYMLGEEWSSYSHIHTEGAENWVVGLLRSTSLSLKA